MENGAASVGSRRTWLPNPRLLIMAGQVAIACTLLIGATLLARSFLAMLHADRGFDVSGALTARLGIPGFAFTPERRIDVLNRVVDRVRLLPGASHIGFTTGLPLTNSETISGFTMKSVRAPMGTQIEVHTLRSVVTEDYFAAIGMRMLAGRGYTYLDTANSPKVIVVNRAFAKQYLTDHAIGDHIANSLAAENNGGYEVIGIVDDVIKHGVSDPPQAEVYSLNRQTTASTI